MLKNLLFTIGMMILILLSSCNYDPPPKGVQVYIENQTNKIIFVSQSFLEDTIINLYDTFYVNNRLQIEANGRLVYGYTKYNLFLSDLDIKKMSKDSLFTIYFLKEKSLNLSPKEVRKNKLYDSLILNINDIRKNQVNHVFIYDTLIISEHKFNITHKK
jgi:hypothetical protein